MLYFDGQLNKKINNNILNISFGLNFELFDESSVELRNFFARVFILIKKIKRESKKTGSSKS